MELEIHCQDTNCQFHGSLMDEDILPTGKGYIFEYFFQLHHYHFHKNTMIVDVADLSIATRMGTYGIPVDIEKEVEEIKKEIKKYQKLAATKPNYKGTDGLTYGELVGVYEEHLQLLQTIHPPLLEQLKMQIKDRMTPELKSQFKEISFEVVHPVPFTKNTKKQIGKIVLNTKSC